MNVEYTKGSLCEILGKIHSPIGEIDAGGYSKNNLILSLYEVKSSLRGWRKANNQLRRAEQYFVPIFRNHYQVDVQQVELYIAYYEGMKHIVEQIR